MPCGKVREIHRDHSRREFEFGLHHTLAVERFALELPYNIPTVVPGVKVPAVFGQHLGIET